MKKKMTILFSLLFSLGVATTSVSAAPDECEIDKKVTSYQDYKTWVKSYGTPVVKYKGTAVYDRALTGSDFTIEQERTNEYTRDVYETTHYKTPPSDADYTCDEEKELINNDKVYKTDKSTHKGSASNLTITVDSDTKKTNGKVRYKVTGTMNGKSKTVYETSFWVTQVNITAGSKEDYYNKGYSPSVSCKITYGDSVVKNCSSGDRDEAGTNKLNSDKRKEIESQVKHPSLDAFLIKDYKYKDIPSPPTYHPTRIDSPHREKAIQQAEISFYDGATTTNPSGATQVKHNYGFADVYIVSYKDKHTGKEDTKINKAWKSAVVDVEDETNESSANKKDVYAKQRTWTGREFEIDVLQNVTCELIFYGPMPSKDCMEDVVVERNVEYRGYIHEHGTETMEKVFSGQTLLRGNEYEYIRYKVQSFEDHILADSDTRTIIHVIDVQVDEAFSRKSGGGHIESIPSAPREVTVLETHKKGVKTPKTYPGGHEGYVWNGYVEEYENYKTPTCVKTFAPSQKTNEIRKDSCTSEMFYKYADITNFGKVHQYKLGASTRNAAIGYLENGYWAYIPYRFNYAMDVEITVSDDYTYQDEPYPSVTCTKTYPSLGKDLSCLDRMYIDKDTGQNDSMGGERKITYKYVNNDYSDEEIMTRVYVNKVEIAEPAKTEGLSGTRQNYQCLVYWQDGETKDVTNLENVWSSDVLGFNYVGNPGNIEDLAAVERVNYISENWSGYTDKKGNYHGPDSINQLYIPDPVSKQYRVNCDYPKDLKYNNGLPAWSYATDKNMDKKDGKGFYVIGVSKLELFDITSRFHGSSNGGQGIDIGASGQRLTGSYGTLMANAYSGNSGNQPPSLLSSSFTKAFNNKTYQTGHWYDFQARITYDASPTTGARRVINVTNVSEALPEATFSYVSNEQAGAKRSIEGASNFRTDRNGYPESKYATVDTFMPTSSLDHRVPQDGWNAIRFDYMNEANLRSPSGQNNTSQNNKAKLFEEGWYWSHSPLTMRIEGPRGPGASEQPPTAKFGQDYTFQSKLLWSDGYEKDQALYNGDTVRGRYVGENNNPWGVEHRLPMNVTGLNWTGWKATEYGDVTTTNNTITFRFEDFEGNNNRRTVASWWGDAEAGAGYVGAGFRYWDYFFQEIDILIDDPVNACADIDVPKQDCPLPIDGGSGDNYRMPENIDAGDARLTIFGIDFNVTGVSKGDGR